MDHNKNSEASAKHVKCCHVPPYKQPQMTALVSGLAVKALGKTQTG